MKLIAFTRAALATSLIAATFSARAIPPEIQKYWPEAVSVKNVYIHHYMPGACDNAVLYSLDTWNSAGAAVAYGWPTNYVITQRNSEQTRSFDDATITVEDGLLGGAALMVAEHRVAADGYTLLDSDIYVERNYLFYGDTATGEFFCSDSRTATPPAYLYDYRSAMVHELGHTLGFQTDWEWYDNAGCVMYGQLARGIVRRSLCPDEYNAVRAVYGIR